MTHSLAMHVRTHPSCEGKDLLPGDVIVFDRVADRVSAEGWHSTYYELLGIEPFKQPVGALRDTELALVLCTKAYTSKTTWPTVQWYFAVVWFPSIGKRALILTEVSNSKITLLSRASRDDDVDDARPQRR